mmetsp:Transcript_6880/g.12170  ORF Transcript_6880/g.12170 Transcript_6880/m.12170 type:complete len:155 (+) Transcript_6880:77-541(+)
MAHAKLMPLPQKVFQAPYNHLRHQYPETWKKLNGMLEEGDPAPPGLEMKQGRLKTSTSLPNIGAEGRRKRSESEKAERRARRERREQVQEKAENPEQPKERRRKKPREITEEELISQMRRAKAFAVRNNFGGVCEGVCTYHNIAGDYKHSQRSF